MTDEEMIYICAGVVVKMYERKLRLSEVRTPRRIIYEWLTTDLSINVGKSLKVVATLVNENFIKIDNGHCLLTRKGTEFAKMMDDISDKFVTRLSN